MHDGKDLLTLLILINMLFWMLGCICKRGQRSSAIKYSKQQYLSNQLYQYMYSTCFLQNNLFHFIPLTNLRRRRPLNLVVVLPVVFFPHGMFHQLTDELSASQG